MSRRAKKREIEICYLCGLPLSGDINRDHVPMKHLYGKESRRIVNPDLYCLPTHAKCNSEYSTDEDYFVYSLVPGGMHKQPGSFVKQDITNRARKGEQKPLLMKVLQQFEIGIRDPINGMRYIPPDGRRIGRVLWKITRGLYLKETGAHIDAASADHIIDFYTEDESLPTEISDVIKAIPGKGEYPPVFDYRYIVLDHAHCFLMSLWDSFTFLTAFHLPECGCHLCIKKRPNQAMEPTVATVEMKGTMSV